MPDDNPLRIAGVSDEKVDELKKSLRTRLRKVRRYARDNAEPLMIGASLMGIYAIVIISHNKKKQAKHDYLVRLPKVQFDRIAKGKDADGIFPSMFYHTPVADLVILNEADLFRMVETAAEQGKQLTRVDI